MDELEVVIMENLTDKQNRFAEEYLIDLNATQAAIRAGYSKKTAGQIGEQNLKKLEIQEYIKEKISAMQTARIAEATEVMEYLTAVMRREKTESVVVTIKEKRSIYMPDEHGTMRKQTVESEVPQVVEIPARLSDANKAAELLGKRYSMFTDKLDINAPVQIVIEDDYGD